MYARLIHNIQGNPPAIDRFSSTVRYILGRFPTRKPHNRFDVGGAIELGLVDLLRETCPDYRVGIPDNSVLTDITINDWPVSIKYSGGSGNVILKNTMGNSETVLEFPDLFLVKPSH